MCNKNPADRNTVVLHRAMYIGPDCQKKGIHNHAQTQPQFE